MTHPLDAGYTFGLDCPPLTQQQADWVAALLAQHQTPQAA